MTEKQKQFLASLDERIEYWKKEQVRETNDWLRYAEIRAEEEVWAIKKDYKKLFVKEDL